MTRRFALALLLAAACGGDDDGAVDDDPLFGMGHVLEVDIEMAPGDWDALRRQTRSVLDILYGDCLAWPVTGVHQRAWEHAGWGFHCGSVLPDDVSGLLNLIELSPADPDEPIWRAVVHAYAYGYLLPACALTPFGIYPLGDCEGETRFFGPSSRSTCNSIGSPWQS